MKRILFVPLYILSAISDWYGKKYIGEQLTDEEIEDIEMFDYTQWEQHRKNR